MHLEENDDPNKTYELLVDLNDAQEAEDAIRLLISLVVELRGDLRCALCHYDLFNDDRFCWVWDDNVDLEEEARFAKLSKRELQYVKAKFDNYQETLARATRALKRMRRMTT